MDIDADWEAIRSIPKQHASKGSAELSDAWRVLRNLPESFYYVVKGVGYDYMAVFKVRCMGEVRRDRRLGGLCYWGVKEEVIWQGPSFRARPEDQGKQYAYAKQDCDLTLAGAVARFNKYRQQFLQDSRDHMRNLEKSIADLQASIDKEKKRCAEVEAFDLAQHLGVVL